MKTVYTVLQELSATTSKLEKLAILKENVSNEELQKFFYLVFNPYINFYIKKIPAYKNDILSDGTLAKSMECLERDLASRKFTGNAAKEYLSELLENSTDEDGECIKRIIAKDAKAGISGDTVNKVWKNLIPTYPCLLASAYEDSLVDKIFARPGNKYIQLKSDGLRCNIVIDKNGLVKLFTRAGREMDVLGRFDVLGSIPALREKVLDGELLTINSLGKFNNRQISNGICSKAVKGTMSQEEADILHMATWDIIDLADFQAYEGTKTYDNRFKELMSLFENSPQIVNLISLIPSKLVKTKAEAWAFFQEKLDEGEEGALLKHGDLIFEDKRSKLQMKLKSEVVCSLKVVGFKEGLGVLQGNLGALAMSSEEGKLNCNISGFDLKTRSEIYANLTGENVIYKVMGKDGWEARVAKPGDIDVSIGTICDVMYNQKIMESGGTWSLFLPRFDAVRFDKTTADTFDHIK